MIHGNILCDEVAKSTKSICFFTPAQHKDRPAPEFIAHSRNLKSVDAHLNICFKIIFLLFPFSLSNFFGNNFRARSGRDKI